MTNVVYEFDPGREETRYNVLGLFGASEQESAWVHLRYFEYLDDAERYAKRYAREQGKKVRVVDRLAKEEE